MRCHVYFGYRTEYLNGWKLVHSALHGGQVASLPGSAYWMRAHGAERMIALQSTSFDHGQSLACVWSDWDLIVSGCVEGATQTKVTWQLRSRQNIMCEKTATVSYALSKIIVTCVVRTVALNYAWWGLLHYAVVHFESVLQYIPAVVSL